MVSHLFHDLFYLLECLFIAFKPVLALLLVSKILMSLWIFFLIVVILSSGAKKRLSKQCEFQIQTEVRSMTQRSFTPTQCQLALAVSMEVSPSS